MYESLNEHSSDFHLYIFAFDSLTNEILLDLVLDKVTVVSLKEFETPELKEVKKRRSRAEYCWTCTPSVISYTLKKYNVPECTYIDSDLYFYSDPIVLFSEMMENKKSVLITEHRFAALPRIYEKKRAGRFCVQYITFLNEADSLHVLEKWRIQCIDWCYARYEDGKFGDQKYLEDWPLSYRNIHILQHLGGGTAPWNLTQYRFTKDYNSISGMVRKTRSVFKVVFFHFQYVKFLENGSIDIGWYYIPASIKRLFYTPYLKKISEIETRLHKLNVSYTKGFTKFKADSLRSLLKIGIKKAFSYNIRKLNNGIPY